MVLLLCTERYAWFGETADNERNTRRRDTLAKFNQVTSSPSLPCFCSAPLRLPSRVHFLAQTKMVLFYEYFMTLSPPTFRAVSSLPPRFVHSIRFRFFLVPFPLPPPPSSPQAPPDIFSFPLFQSSSAFPFIMQYVPCVIKKSTLFHTKNSKSEMQGVTEKEDEKSQLDLPLLSSPLLSFPSPRNFEPRLRAPDLANFVTEKIHKQLRRFVHYAIYVE